MEDHISYFSALKNSMELCRRIAATNDAASSPLTNDNVTNALRKALWGAEWLEKFGDSLKAAFPVIEEARADVNTRLSEVIPRCLNSLLNIFSSRLQNEQRRRYCEDGLKESEDKLAWEEYRYSFAKLKACHDRVIDCNRTASNVIDNVGQDLHLCTFHS